MYEDLNLQNHSRILAKYGRVYEDLEMILQNHTFLPIAAQESFRHSGTDSPIHESKFGRVYEDSWVANPSLIG